MIKLYEYTTIKQMLYEINLKLEIKKTPIRWLVDWKIIPNC